MHADDQVLLRRIDGELEPERLALVESHLRECAGCAGRAALLAGETELLRAALAEQPGEATLPARSFGSRELLALAGAFAVSAAAFHAPWPEPLASIASTVASFLSTSWTLAGSSLAWPLLAELAAALPRLGILTLLLGLLAGAGARATRARAATTVLLLLAVAAGSPARAAVLHTGDEPFVLRAGLVLDDDLVAATDNVRIEGELRGDLMTMARQVTITGRVHGDVLGAIRELNVDGTVDGDVRVLGEQIHVAGHVKSLSAGASLVEVLDGARVDGSVAAGAALVRLQGAVARNVFAGGSRIEMRAPIGGDARFAARELLIAEGARIPGVARYYGPGEPEVAPGAELANPLEITRADFDFDRSPGPAQRALWFTLRWGAAVAFGIAWLLIAPGALRAVIDHADRVGISMLIGLVAVVATPLVALVLAATLIGLPVGLVTLWAYVSALYAAQLFVAYWLARRTFGDPAGPMEAMLRLALALLVLHALAQIPYAGGAVRLVVLLWGLGAAVLALGHSVTGRYREV